MAVRWADGHVFTAPRGTVIDTDGGTALQLTAEPLTTHAVVAILQWGANKPQSLARSGRNGCLAGPAGP